MKKVIAAALTLLMAFTMTSPVLAASGKGATSGGFTDTVTPALTSAAYSYKPGETITFRIAGNAYMRCYSGLTTRGYSDPADLLDDSSLREDKFVALGKGYLSSSGSPTTLSTGDVTHKVSTSGVAPGSYRFWFIAYSYRYTSVGGKLFVTGKNYYYFYQDVSIDAGASSKPDAPGQTAVTGVKLNTATRTLTAGKTYQLKATVSPAGAANKAVSWKSSRPAVASVSAAGKVTAKKAGTARITVTTASGKKTASCTVTVAAAVTQVKPVAASVRVVKGKTLKAQAVAYVNGGGTARVSYTSSNKRVATVSSNGTIKGVAAGTTRITAKADNGRKATITVRVVAKAVPLKKITLSNAPTSIKVGASRFVSIKAAPATATGVVARWKSTNPKVLTVDAAGRITAKKAGRATLVATVGSRTVRKTITVKA